MKNKMQECLKGYLRINSYCNRLLLGDYHVGGRNGMSLDGNTLYWLDHTLLNSQSALPRLQNLRKYEI